MYRSSAIAGAAVAITAIASAALAEPNTTLMDLSLGPWTLVAGNGTNCSLTLGDEPVANSARALSGGGDCRSVDSALDRARSWRIDEPSELVFLDDNGKVVARMAFDQPSGEFHGVSVSKAPLTLQPSE